MKKTTNLIFFITYLLISININSFAQTTGTLKDLRDGHVYKTVKIGNQWWMAENLAYDVGEECWHKGRKMDIELYGRYYYMKIALHSCPQGWHLPSVEEWSVLIENLGGEKIAGAKLKETGNSHWNNTNINVTNESGFSALPAGFCIEDFTRLNTRNVGYNAYWWTSTIAEDYIDNAYNFQISDKYNGIYKGKHHNEWGFSVRCVKD